MTDRELVVQVQENPYLQYFLGLDCFKQEALFDASMMVHFRKRFSQEALHEINEAIIKPEASAQACAQGNEPDDKDDSDDGAEPKSGSDETALPLEEEESPNEGSLLIDATVAPADITYPTDLKLLNAAREVTEKCIDALFLSLVGKERKPRTYRKNARDAFLSVSKQKGPRKKTIRKGVGQQLRFIKRNLHTIDMLAAREGIGLGQLSHRLYRLLLVSSEVYRQQQFMYEHKVHQIQDRIVSLSQPHVRPIVRGKTAAKVEFGAKLSVSLSQGHCQVERLSWDAFHEAEDLVGQAESYRQRYGHYPEVICADKIYRTADNRKWGQSHRIRLSGRTPGRPPQDPAVAKALRKQIAQDEKARIPIEGKFGQAKRRFSLERIMSKLAQTSITSIFMTFIAMNLNQALYFLFDCLTGLSKLIDQLTDDFKACAAHINRFLPDSKQINADYL